MTQLTRERLVKDTRLLRSMLREYMTTESVRDYDKKRALYQSMGWEMDEYMWDEMYFIHDMIRNHSHGNARAEQYLRNFMEHRQEQDRESNTLLNNTMSHFITLVTGIPQPKSTAERMRLKRQEQDRIAQSRQRPPPRKKGQRKNRR